MSIDPFLRYLTRGRFRSNLTEDSGPGGDVEIRNLLENCGLPIEGDPTKDLGGELMMGLTDGPRRPLPDEV